MNGLDLSHRSKDLIRPSQPSPRSSKPSQKSRSLDEKKKQRAFARNTVELATLVRPGEGSQQEDKRKSVTFEPSALLKRPDIHSSLAAETSPITSPRASPRDPVQVEGSRTAPSPRSIPQPSTGGQGGRSIEDIRKKVADRRLRANLAEESVRRKGRSLQLAKDALELAQRTLENKRIALEDAKVASRLANFNLESAEEALKRKSETPVFWSHARPAKVLEDMQ